jgi:hypothetical protein
MRGKKKMQQKESFLKTKKGKIVVGSVVGSIIGLLVILAICYFMECWPFGKTSITEENVTQFGTDVKALVEDTKVKSSATENNKIVVDVVKKIEALKKQVDKVNNKRDEAKQITTSGIDKLKTEAEKLKDKDETNFKTASKTFTTEVDNLVTSLKSDINIKK